MGKRFLNRIEQIQDEHCDYTRGTAKRFRVLRNIGEAAPFFPVDEPVLCFGSGDGFEVEVWRLLGYDAIGCDISRTKRMIAAEHGILTLTDINRLNEKRNIYCAHTLEHLTDRKDMLHTFERMSLSRVCCIVPIEPGGTKNPSHLSPIRTIDALSCRGRVIRKYERWNDEREGIVIWQTNIM